MLSLTGARDDLGRELTGFLGIPDDGPGPAGQTLTSFVDKPLELWGPCGVSPFLILPEVLDGIVQRLGSGRKAPSLHERVQDVLRFG